MGSWGQTHRNYHTRAGPMEMPRKAAVPKSASDSLKKTLDLSISLPLSFLFPLHRKSCSFLSVVIRLSSLPKQPIGIIIKISQVSLEPLAVHGRFSQTCFYIIILVFIFCFIELYFMFSFIIKSTIPHKSSKFKGSISGQWISRNPIYEVRQWP